MPNDLPVAVKSIRPPAALARPPRRLGSSIGRRWRALLAVAALGVCAVAGADTLTLPPNLIGLATESGERLLIGSGAREAYWPLSLQFVTQKNQAFCGVATAVMVLNALAVPAPPTPGFEPFNAFTQDNVLDEKTEPVLPQALLMRQGMTLDQFAGILGTKGVTAEVRHAQDGGLDAFRTAAIDYLGRPRHHVVVNYLRRSLGQERGGHISPLAAYDAATDRFLVLDVSRYKYPPVWVTAADLYAAMNTVDDSNEGKTRGYVLVH